MLAGRYSRSTLLLEAGLIALALVFLYPLFIVVSNSFKSFSEIMLDSAGLPKVWIVDNYVNAWQAVRFPRVLWNSLLITVLSNAGLVVISSMAAWRLVRYPARWSRVLFLAFVAAMVIPFQAIMLPLMEVGGYLHLIDRVYGLIIMYLGFGVSFTLFLFQGFIKSIPGEVEESAIIDGCGTQALFWRIVFPLLKPISVTALILNSLWIWNDFLLPVMVLQDDASKTIPLAMYSFFAQYSRNWDLALAMLVMSMTPIIMFFLIMQRYVINGIMAGSVKG